MVQFLRILLILFCKDYSAMDSKSLAKSKRAHTLHHSKKSHSVHKPKVPGVSEKNPEKLQGNQTKSPVQSRRVSALPSNWDRYDDELDAAEDSSISLHSDVIVPKSKGADYLHLISEAQAESNSKIENNLDCLSSLDDLLHGMKSILFVCLCSCCSGKVFKFMSCCR